jgi:hypothetical protein
MSGLSSDSDKAKQTQEMHCFANRGLKCSDLILAEMSHNPLDSERGSRDEPGAELRSRLSSQSRTAPRIRCSRASAGLLTPDVKRDQAGDETYYTPGISQ